LGASPGLVASPQAATGASARRLTINQQAGPKSTVSHASGCDVSFAIWQNH
jgi:hypothetical protein